MWGRQCGPIAAGHWPTLTCSRTYVVTVGANHGVTALLLDPAWRTCCLPLMALPAADAGRVHRHLDPRHLFRASGRRKPTSWGRCTRAVTVTAVTSDPADLGVRDPICARHGGHGQWTRSHSTRIRAWSIHRQLAFLLRVALGLVITGLIIWIHPNITPAHQISRPGAIHRQGFGNRPRHKRHSGSGDQPLKLKDRAADAG